MVVRLAVLLLVVSVSCSGSSTGAPPTLKPQAIPSGPLAPALRANLDGIFGDPVLLSEGDIAAVGASGDVRAAWPLVDLLRFHQGQVKGPEIVTALGALTGVSFDPQNVEWVDYSNLLLREDVPAAPGYFEWKRTLFVAIHEAWEPFFDPKAHLDWREVTWGGVFRDAIVALTDPPVVPASRGTWLPDDDVVFGVAVGGEARAYPKRVMEVHELVNDTLGGRRIAIPYCTLCGAAIPYYTDGVDGPPLELRTSGLLQRSNKLMYDARTESLFEQFSGEAVTGPLREADVKLPRFAITVTTWGEWKRAHADTTVTPEEIEGRAYGPHPLGGRDASGPIFPVGSVDDRLGAQEVVFGVHPPGSKPIAFPVKAARRALWAGLGVSLNGVTARLQDGGLRATFRGRDLVGHEAYWFAWSQFKPGTFIWTP